MADFRGCWAVAQVSNLPYRRLPAGIPAQARECLRIGNPRNGRLEVCATKAISFLLAVAASSETCHDPKIEGRFISPSRHRYFEGVPDFTAL